jgi:hypothetical protein
MAPKRGPVFRPKHFAIIESCLTEHYSWHLQNSEFIRVNSRVLLLPPDLCTAGIASTDLREVTPWALP